MLKVLLEMWHALFPFDQIDGSPPTSITGGSDPVEDDGGESNCAPSVFLPDSVEESVLPAP